MADRFPRAPASGPGAATRRTTLGCRATPEARWGPCSSPAAAMLFADWLPEEGQAFFAAEGLTPAFAAADDPLAGLDVLPMDVGMLVKENEKWLADYPQVIERSGALQ